ncbi:glycosyl hydrolase 115 family protein [Clostridium estertheticum]|uniref:glycosyl hydrolase 115 family protein n=1 Tax=Clostridium estertheticum TaxID=238834 RepID=UPI00209AF9BE|nr:glycosyl hydrolase 115 family protein [Clostridium estertheticum]
MKMLQDNQRCDSVAQVLSQGEATVSLVTELEAIMIYVDSKGKDYGGLRLVALSFADDINMVTGITPLISMDIKQLNGTVVIAGSIGNNDLIDSLVKEGIIDISYIKNKRECYKIIVVRNPVAGIDKAIVVVGSDKRGAIYGIYHISELIGVSPWVYFGDVAPIRQSELIIPEYKLNITSKEPSVKYRGFFLNDEWPSLGKWVTGTFGDFNEEFYDKVFQLLLRLKGNFLWPAMWSAVFSENGKSSAIANAKLADAYGIVMGTSHHEPMFRAGEEWRKINQQYGTNSAWDFSSNAQAITKFWEDGLLRNKDFESLITLGMRGEQDSELVGSEEENIQLLKSIIRAQKSLLKKHGLADAPQVLTIYKEVEKYWYGSDKVEGLRDWDVLDDVTIMLADDNFGNLRTLPTDKERNRRYGFGMYYHFDYHGGPCSYEWVNSTPLEKVWEQMSMAFDYGVHNIWVVNVGDLKPQELPISYFLDLAYDFDAFGTDAIIKTTEYTKQWVRRQFGKVLEEDITDGIANVLSDYTRMNGKRKPEITLDSTYSCINYNEAQRVLTKAINMEKTSKKYYKCIPEAYKDVYYQLVHYPAVASANVVKMQIFAGFNKLYYDRNSVLANYYAKLVKECIETDNNMQSYYNNSMSDGKWNGMMSSPHIGYTKWSSDGWAYPQVNYINPKDDSCMIVVVEGTENEGLSLAASLLEFTNLGKESYFINISNGSGKSFHYKVEASEDWIKVDNMEGSINIGKTIRVCVNWSKVSKTTSGVIKIFGGEKTVKVNVKAEVIDTYGLPNMTFIEAHNVVSIEAEHTVKNIARSNVQWKIVKNYGRSLSCLKMFPTTVSFEKTEDAPYLEYIINVNEDSKYILTTYVAPTNNLYVSSRLRYGVSFDGEASIIADALPVNFVAGTNGNKAWEEAVMENIHTMTTTHKLEKGIHTLRFYGLDAGIILQKLVLSKEKLLNSFFGPEESFYIRKEDSK